MSEPTDIVPPIVPYACTLGTVLDHRDGGYIIATPDGRVIGVQANGEPSPENVEADIVNPPEPEPSIEQIWEAYLAGHYTDIETGLELKTSISACNRFSSMETLLKSALEHGTITSESPVPIWDRHNVEHSMTVTECRALLLRYGIAWQAAFNELAP